MAATRASARGTVLRSALVFAPFLAITLAGFLFIARETAAEGASAGRIVALSVTGLIALLFSYPVLQSVRDLFARPVETGGVVERRWSRADFFLFRSSYIFVQGTVFRLEPEQYLEVDLGDTVRVVHYPHTSTVEALEVVARAGETQDARRG
jgi:hypothetical protein